MKNGNLFGLLITVSLLIWVILLVTGNLPFKVFLVQSGSMEPSIMTGDVILVKNKNFYGSNEVITFRDNTERVVTHRIIDMNSDGSLVTKGDANKDEDRETVNKNKVIGKVVFVIPRLGYLVNFMKSLPGFVSLVLLPAGYLLVSELSNIGHELHKRR